MAHFAKLNEANIVTGIEVVVDSVITDGDGAEQEQLGIDFLTQLYGGVGWYKQTSYNGTFRKNFAGVGGTYDVLRDAFIAAQPYTDWTLNETTCKWEAPVAYPDASKKYFWNEETTNWVEGD
jgi:hypothetical protein